MQTRPFVYTGRTAPLACAAWPSNPQGARRVRRGLPRGAQGGGGLRPPGCGGPSRERGRGGRGRLARFGGGEDPAGGNGEGERPGRPPGTLVLPADDHLGGLAHACETMAVKVIAPKLQRELKPCPVDEGQVIVIRALLSRMAWALDRAAELSAERKRRA